MIFIYAYDGLLQISLSRGNHGHKYVYYVAGHFLQEILGQVFVQFLHHILSLQTITFFQLLNYTRIFNYFDLF
jgi:Zn/Cd-binding protein ZinT